MLTYADYDLPCKHPRHPIVKLACVLMTVAITSKGHRIDSNSKNVVLAVVLLIEEDAGNVLASSLTNTIASGVIKHIEPVINHLSFLADFTSVNSLTQAKTTLALKDMSD